MLKHSTHECNANKSKGFTLVELLIVIGIIGLLAAVTISVLNPTSTRNRAADGVARGNLAKVQQGLEAYNTVEDAYPTTLDLSDPLVQTYLSEIPEDNYSYWSDGTEMGIVVPLRDNPSLVYKYRSEWGEIRTCSSTGDSGNQASSLCDELDDGGTIIADPGVGECTTSSDCVNSGLPSSCSGTRTCNTALDPTECICIAAPPTDQCTTSANCVSLNLPATCTGTRTCDTAANPNVCTCVAVTPPTDQCTTNANCVSLNLPATCTGTRTCNTAADPNVCTCVAISPPPVIVCTRDSQCASMPCPEVATCNRTLRQCECSSLDF